jgi:hypothetical protein
MLERRRGERADRATGSREPSSGRERRTRRRGGGGSEARHEARHGTSRRPLVPHGRTHHLRNSRSKGQVLIRAGGFSIGSHATAAGSSGRGQIRGEGAQGRTEIGAATAALRPGGREIGIWRRLGETEKKVPNRKEVEASVLLQCARVSLGWAPHVCLPSLLISDV